MSGHLASAHPIRTNWGYPMTSTTLTTTTRSRWADLLNRPRPLWIKIVGLAVITVVLAGAGLGIRAAAATHTDNPNRKVPVNAAMQDQLGIRFTRAAVVADGGLITLSYVVLDPEKATKFQAEQAHPPKLSSESRNLSTSKVSLMKQGHVLNAGQTYYLVYENTRAALRPGEQVTITDKGLTLAHFPVL
jgi:hypothetical protein